MPHVLRSGQPPDRESHVLGQRPAKPAVKGKPASDMWKTISFEKKDDAKKDEQKKEASRG